MEALENTAKCMVRFWIAMGVSIVPITLRKRAAKWLFRQKRLPGSHWLALELLADFRRNEYSEYHKFLWKNHLFYAATYNVETRFGLEKQKESGRKFFEALLEQLHSLQIPADRITSILEVGCSLGYQLRLMETDIFPNAKKLLGIDIDEIAIAEGRKVLASQDSLVELVVSDIEHLSDIVDARKFDIVVCTGVLMYLDENSASTCVAGMVGHTKHILGVSGLANRGVPNSQLEHSALREWDHSLKHNLEKMVLAGGARILGVGWEDEKIVDERSMYFVFGSPTG